MLQLIPVLRWIVRLCALAALGMGLVFWNGSGYNLLSAHQGLGYLVSGGLLLLALLGFSRRVSPGLLVLGLVWALAVPAVGSMQASLLPGNPHWVIKVIHLLVGLGAVALSEIIAGRALRSHV